jgi:peptide/nickel transport system permease protein
VKFKKRFSFSGFLILSILGVCLAAPIIAPYDPNAIGVADAFSGPTARNWMGADDLGRDLFSRILYGGRITILIAMSATVIALLIGTTWGLVAGVRRGWVDEFLMRTADATMAIPQILFALVCVSAVGASVISLPIVVGFLLSPTTARMARSAVVTELASDYVTAAIASGTKRSKLILSEVMPTSSTTQHQRRRRRNVGSDFEFYRSRHTTSQRILGNFDAARLCQDLEYLLVCLLPSTCRDNHDFGI